MALSSERKSRRRNPRRLDLNFYSTALDLPPPAATLPGALIAS